MHRQILRRKDASKLLAVLFDVGLLETDRRLAVDEWQAGEAGFAVRPKGLLQGYTGFADGAKRMTFRVALLELEATLVLFGRRVQTSFMCIVDGDAVSMCRPTKTNETRLA
jgi:hypothetical protein